MSDINVIVSPSTQKRVIVGTPGVTYQPIDYRQGIVDITSGVSDINFLFVSPFTKEPIFRGDVIYNGLSYDDGYGHHIYNLSKTGCSVCLSDSMHTTGYQFHYYATVIS